MASKPHGYFPLYFGSKCQIIPSSVHILHCRNKVILVVIINLYNSDFIQHLYNCDNLCVLAILGYNCSLIAVVLTLHQGRCRFKKHSVTYATYLHPIQFDCHMFHYYEISLVLTEILGIYGML